MNHVSQDRRVRKGQKSTLQRWKQDGLELLYTSLNSCFCRVEQAAWQLLPMVSINTRRCSINKTFPQHDGTRNARPCMDCVLGEIYQATHSLNLKRTEMRFLVKTSTKTTTTKRSKARFLTPKTRMPLLGLSLEGMSWNGCREVQRPPIDEEAASWPGQQLWFGCTPPLYGYYQITPIHEHKIPH